MIDIDKFMALSVEDIAEIIREKGTKVAACPINGTRRWFKLEHLNTDDDYVESYLEEMSKKYIDIFSLFFKYGVETLLTPNIGEDILERGDAYMEILAEGLKLLTTGPMFLDFYKTYDVRVYFYGAYKKHFIGSPFEYLLDEFERISEITKNNSGHKLYWGFFAGDATETISKIAVDYFEDHGVIPRSEQTIEIYYGELLSPLDFYIGFDRFSFFDIPLLTSGFEDLYFMVAPNPYLTDAQFREILFDHLFLRPVSVSYDNLTMDDWIEMGRYYSKYEEKTFGVGRLGNGGVWYPKI